MITGAETGVAILTAENIGATDVTWAPRQATHDVADASALTYDGTYPVHDFVVLAHEKIQIAMTNAGAGVRTGTFDIWVG